MGILIFLFFLGLPALGLLRPLDDHYLLAQPHRRAHAGCQPLAALGLAQVSDAGLHGDPPGNHQARRFLCREPRGRGGACRPRLGGDARALLRTPGYHRAARRRIHHGDLLT